MSENQQHASGDAVPAEVRRVHQRLLDDGDTWRAQFPSSEAFRRDVETFRLTATAQTTGVYPHNQDNRQRWREREGMYNAPAVRGVPGGLAPTRSKPRYLRSLVAVAAMLVVAALFAVAFQMVSGSRPAQIVPPTVTSPSVGVWQTSGQFQSRTSERVMVAQSDPQVVYRINSRMFAMERSGDGGVTWHAVTLPAEVMQAPLKTYSVFDINPLNANTVYLTAFGDRTSPSCPSPFLPGGQNRSNYTCSIQYVSTDGGARWQRLMLPSNGQLAGMLTQYLGSPRASLLSQGNRVYSLMTTDAFVGAYRLVVSMDGVAWQLADDTLAATGLRIESYTVSPTGTTLWTALSDNSLWRSDDAGTNWTRAADLPQAQSSATAGPVAARTIDGRSFIYLATYSPPLGDIAPNGIQVSVDGGKTWQASPTRGVPDGQFAAPHSAMTLANGTLVMLFRRAEVSFAFDEGILHDAAYYAWKPGAKSWTRLTPTFDAEAVEQQWVAPQSGAGAAETVWALIYRDAALTYDGEAYIKDGVYAISRCGLG